MSAFDLIFGAKRRVRIGVGASDEFLPVGAVELDASLQENHVLENEITEFPVEEGTDITDHIRKKPERVTITGIITNHPNTFGGALGNPDRAGEAYEKFLEMVNKAQVVTVVTTLRQYANMAIESISIPRSAQKGQHIEVTISLREIKTAVVESVTPAPATGVGSSAGTQDLGAQNAVAV